jgi:hypothetical protein
MNAGRAGQTLKMSALGHERTFCDAAAMSALPPKADIEGLGQNVC